MSLGRNAAKPAIIRPSEAPAKFRKKNVGLRSRAKSACGRSAIREVGFDGAASVELAVWLSLPVVVALLVLLQLFAFVSCASETLPCCSSSAPLLVEDHGFINAS